MTPSYDPTDPTEATTGPASAAGLRRALVRIADEGWDGPAGRAVLRYAHDQVVIPQVRRTGLRGAAADQAIATGWAAAWELLASGRTRRTGSPWGVVAVAVRRAVLGEALAHRYGTTVRTAWRLRDRGVAPPVSLEAISERGYGLPAPRESATGAPVLAAVTELLAAAGWEHEDVLALVEWAAARAEGRRLPWRTVAERCGVPVGDARRVAALLVGRPDWPGLIERVARNGTEILAEPEVRAVVYATTRRTCCVAPARRAS